MQISVLILFLSHQVIGRRLPDDLLIATATSAYQIEGAWNLSGKGKNIWDRFVHTHPDQILGGSNGDVAVDFYHKTDVLVLKEIGFQHYRFSISWSRVLPQGFSNYVNLDGIAYYNNLIDSLLENGIKPIVTMYHWDLPQTLQKLGGWANDEMSTWFKDYASVLYDHFGDRIELWFTINDPKQICKHGNGSGNVPPSVKAPGIGDYLCIRNVLLAHAAAYRLYKERKFSGKIGLAINCNWFEPETEAGASATERLRQFEYGLYVNPIYYGDFPSVVKKSVAKRSKLEGFYESRLPALTSDEKKFIKGTSDYFGVNYYTTFYVKDAVPQPIGSPSMEKDVSVEMHHDPTWNGSIGVFNSVPWGFRKTLKYIKDNYGNPLVIVGENGFADKGEIRDCVRTKYFLDHLHALLDAIEKDGVRVKMYTASTLMDSFEWFSGYNSSFGLYTVNRTDPNFTRVPKLSATFFRNLLQDRNVPDTSC